MKESASLLEGDISLLPDKGLLSETNRIMDKAEWSICSQQVVDLLAGRLDKLSNLGQFLAEGLEYASDDLLQLTAQSEAIMLAQRNGLTGLETVVGSVDQMDGLDLPSTLWGSITHLTDALDAKVDETKLRSTLNEVITHFEEKLLKSSSLSSSSSRSAIGLTPPSAGVPQLSVGGLPSTGFTSLGAHGPSVTNQTDPMKPWKDEVELMKASLELLRSRLEGENGGAADYSFNGTAISSVEDASAMLEAELKEPYIPLGCL